MDDLISYDKLIEYLKGLKLGSSHLAFLLMTGQSCAHYIRPYLDDIIREEYPSEDAAPVWLKELKNTGNEESARGFLRADIIEFCQPEPENARVYELKPCPFCGGEARIQNHWDAMTDLHYVKCQICGADTLLFGSEEKAIAAWNRRAGVSHG